MSAGQLPPRASNPVVVQKDDADVTANATTLDFEGDDFDVSDSPAGEANISSRFIGARVYNSAAFSHNSSGNYLAVTFDSERFDTDALHSTSSNTSRLTAPVAGYYHIGFSGEWDGNTTGRRFFTLIINGTTHITEIQLVNTDGSARGAPTGFYFLNAGDYVEIYGWQDSGGTRTIVSSPNKSPEFWMYRIPGA